MHSCTRHHPLPKSIARHDRTTSTRWPVCACWTKSRVSSPPLTPSAQTTACPVDPFTKNFTLGVDVKVIQTPIIFILSR
jgi:hypothetical protein